MQNKFKKKNKEKKRKKNLKKIPLKKQQQQTSNKGKLWGRLATCYLVLDEVGVNKLNVN